MGIYVAAIMNYSNFQTFDSLGVLASRWRMQNSSAYMYRDIEFNICVNICNMNDVYVFKIHFLLHCVYFMEI